MYAQTALKPNSLLRNGAYSIVMRGVQKCTCAGASLRDRYFIPLCCIIYRTATDRAQSGTTDTRLEFQRMISDSDKHTFEGVLVYQLDRFARNRYDSAINKSKLKKNGVRVISAKENFADDPSGILV